MSSNFTQKLFIFYAKITPTRAVQTAILSGDKSKNFKEGESVRKLERLSALEMTSKDVKNLEEDILFSQRILNVNTENVEPLYNIVEDHITCPLRDDIVLMNTKNVYEGFFTAPSVGIVTKKEKNVVEM
uniref:Glutamyl-tRNA(Gln) amidotransferase subunit C, mitochondrial n=1 Tax=Meloidogyne floridensis TaxID=298350 RepID=A0A915NDJ2_9BILA